VEAQAQATAPELRPLGVGEIVDVAIKIYWRNALTLFRIVLVVVAPVQLLSSLVTTSSTTSGDFVTTTTDPITGEETVHFHHPYLFVTGIVVVFLLSLVSTILATGACFKAVADAYMGERPTSRSSLAFVLRKFVSILWVILIGGLALLPLFAACLIPGIWIGVAWSVAIPALLTEGAKGTKALGRSWRLVRGRWWPAFGVLLLGFLLSGVVSSVIQYGFTALLLVGVGDSSVAQVVVGTIGGTLSSVLTTPFTAAFVTVLYFDLRVRKEGFDLELLAERLGLAPRPRGEVRPAPPAAALPTGATPPYWPPPPGWRPGPEPSGGGGEAPADPARPPYWPPPPGWTPPAG
jgi:hypothetical protein